MNSDQVYENWNISSYMIDRKINAVLPKAEKNWCAQNFVATLYMYMFRVGPIRRCCY